MRPPPGPRLSLRSLAVPIAAASLVSVLVLTISGQQNSLRLRQAWHAARLASFRTGGSVGANASGAGHGTPGVDGQAGLTAGLVACAVPNPGVPAAGAKSRAAPPPVAAAVSKGRSLVIRLVGFLGMDSLQATLSNPTEGTTGAPRASRVADARPRNVAGTAIPGLGAGILTVGVDTGTAMAIVDGVPRGTTPYAVCLSAGRHTVSARSIGGSYQPARVLVSIDGSDTASVVFRRTPATASP